MAKPISWIGQALLYGLFALIIGYFSSSPHSRALGGTSPRNSPERRRARHGFQLPPRGNGDPETRQGAGDRLQPGSRRDHPAMNASKIPLPEYALPVPDSARQALARAWLWLGLLSLIGSGVFSVLLVLSRTPVLQNLFPVADFFHVALVAHVDLSVLVWFIAIAGMLWSINSSTHAMSWGWLALWGCALGVALMSLAPFIGRGEPIMANYIPVLSDPVFISGLLVFGAGFAALVLRSLVLAPVLGLSFNGGGALRFGLNAAAVSAAVAILAFAWSYAAVPASLGGKAYYELLCWGGGHALQFIWTLLMLVACIW